MSLTFYDFIHVAGLICLIFSLSSAIQLRFSSGGGETDSGSAKRKIMILHGVAMLLLLVGGFGALARLGMSWPWPGFVMVKFAVWMFFGAAPRLIMQKGSAAMWWAVVLGLACVAAYLGLYKPF